MTLKDLQELEYKLAHVIAENFDEEEIEALNSHMDERDIFDTTKLALKLWRQNTLHAMLRSGALTEEEYSIGMIELDVEDEE